METIERLERAGMLRREGEPQGEMYGDTYWSNYERLEGDLQGRKIVRFRTDFVERQERYVVDVGIGSGTFLKFCKRAVRGYDVNPIAERWLKRRGIWHDWPAQPWPLGGATFFDVLEHTPDSIGWLEHARPGQFLAATVPYVTALNRAEESKHWKPGEHVLYWTREGFCAMLESLGWAIAETSNAEERLGREHVVSVAAYKRGHHQRGFYG